jgi:hypothetical protein
MTARTRRVGPSLTMPRMRGDIVADDGQDEEEKEEDEDAK